MKLDPEDEHLRGLLRIRPNGPNEYAQVRGKGKCYLHRILMGNPPGPVDHMNGDTLDNRKANLRLATAEQQGRNTDVVLGKVPYRGVYFEKARQKFTVGISYKGKRIRIGRYSTVAEANQARLVKEKELWGVEPRRKAAHLALDG